MRQFSLCLLFFSFSFGLAQTRMIPHVTASTGGFSTQLILQNTTTDPQAFTLTPFRSDGTSFSLASGTLTPGETRLVSMDDLFGSAPVSHIRINQEAQIQLTVVYQVSDGSNSPAHLGETTTSSMRFRIFPGGQDDVLDGLAAVNLGQEDTDLMIRQVGFDQVEQGRVHAVTLVPNAKGLFLFDSFPVVENSFFEVFASQPLAVTALRFANGIPGARFFWENDALALPPLVETPADPRIGQKATFPPNSTYGITGGQATIVDERTIQIDGLTYAGGGPDVRFFLGMNGNYINGFPISEKISGGAPFNNASFTLTLPEGRTLDDFNGISIWCTVFLLDFSSDLFQ